LRCHLSGRWHGEAHRRLRRHRRLSNGISRANAAFDISTARHIIHAVGPIYSHYTAEEARRWLRSAYVSAIRLAIENGCTSLAFPAMSTGIYGYPLEEACKEAVDVCWAEAQRTGMGIKLVAFDGKTADCLRHHLSARMKVQSSKD
jgi:O-acetyl-ADP-ribose deacetylase (regulator of RNase III)